MTSTGWEPARASSGRHAVSSGLVMFIAVAATTVAITPVFLSSALTLPIRAEFDFGSSQLGAAVAIFFATSSVASLLLGRVVQRLGARTALRTGSILSALATLAIAILIDSWLGLVSCLALAGVSNGMLQPATNLALAEGTRVERQGLSFGIKQAAVPAATLTAGAAVPIVATLIDWRWAFVAAAVIAVLLAVWLPPIGAERPKLVRRSRATARGASGRDDAPDTQVQKIHLPPLLLLSGAMFFGAGVGTATAAFLVETAVAGGWGESAAGQLLMAASLAGFAVRVGAGWQIDRRQDVGLPAVAVLLAVGAAGMLLIVPGQARPWLLAVGVLLALGPGWGWPGLFHFSMVHANRHAPAAASGIGLAGVFGGGVAVPLAFGTVIERVGYEAAWVGGAFGMLIAITLVLASHRLTKRRLQGV